MILQPVIAPLLAILLVLPVLGAAVWMLVRRRPAAAPAIGPRWVWALRVMLVLACGVLVLRPGIPGGEVRTLATSTDVVIAVDTTASMVAEDWNGTAPRMDGVRADVKALLAAYPGARFALITFDAAAELRLPLTTDASALMSAVDVLRPEVTRQSRGSSIGIANALLAETLRKAAASSPDRARLVFYLGDGEQTTSSAPESFQDARAYASGGAVFGYGTAEGGRMRENTGTLGGDGGYIRYQGQDALSTIDEDNLKTIAEQLGVPYAHRTADVEPVFPPPPSTTTAYRENGSTGQVTDLSWIVALVIVALLAVEIVRAVVLATRMRGLAVRPLTAAPPPDPAVPAAPAGGVRTEEGASR